MKQFELCGRKPGYFHEKLSETWMKHIPDSKETENSDQPIMVMIVVWPNKYIIRPSKANSLHEKETAKPLKWFGCNGLQRFAETFRLVGRRGN